MTALQPMADVRRNVRTLREARGWSREEMVARLAEAGHRLSVTQLQFIESGRRKVISVDEFYALAHVLGVPAHRLTQPTPNCADCQDVPPPGFQCRTCGT
ncbi:helix-turn-helix domain-containing protein [Planobispora rosea]|uniref:helix-turn-helix domain-containing protein n=1 Tax=Planobispora rosea TaxID=35762 RepID=UPI00083AAC81|nr:helix-turn-helix transcriptional regulator [Planobispora rosea]